MGKLIYQFAVSFLLTLIGTAGTWAVQDQEMMRQIRLARSHEDAGEWTRAKEIYGRLLLQAPENPMVFDLYFECCLTLKNHEEALAAVDRRLLSDAGDIHAACLRGRVFARSGKKTQAIQEWNHLFEMHPKEESVFRAVAEAMVLEQFPDEAAKIYGRGRKAIGSPAAFALEISGLYEMSGDYGRAASELMNYYRSHPDRGDDVRNRFGRFPKNESVAGQIFNQLKRSPEALSGGGWSFRLFLQYAFLSGNDDEAFKFTENLERRGGTKKSGSSLLLLAEEAISCGHFSAAEKAYRQVLVGYPDFPKKAELLLGIGRCLQSQKNYREALRYYEEAIRHDPGQALNRQALIEKARLGLFELEDPNAAKSAYQILIKNYPTAPEHDQWRLELGQCELILGNFSAAESDFRAVLESERRKSAGNWISPMVLLARNQYYQGQIDESLKTLDPLSTQNLNASSYQDPLLNDALELKMFLREYGSRCREGVRLFARAEFSQKQGRLTEALAVLDSIPEKSCGNGFDAEVLCKRAEIAFQLTRYRETQEIILQFLHEYPDHPKTLHVLVLSAGLNEKIGEYSKAMDQFDRILKEYPNTLAAEESKNRIQALQEKMKP